METHDLTALFLALGVLLAAARGLGELARRCKQPEVLGEILAGIVLGPTIMGVLAPGLMAALADLRAHGAGVLVAAKRDRIAQGRGDRGRGGAARPGCRRPGDDRRWGEPRGHA